MSELYYETAEASRIGHRIHNEDRVAVVRKDDALLLVAADGLGGHPRGDLAAATLVDVMSKEVYRAEAESPEAFLQAGMQHAHEAIVRQGEALDPPLYPMTTGVVCLITGDQAWTAHIGDSRFYLFRDGQPMLRTRDHTLVAELHARGMLPREQMANHPARNRLSRCLGGTHGAPHAEIDGPHPLQAADLLLLCTDGLWSALEDDEILQAFGTPSLQQAAEAVADRAVQVASPASDNVSLVAVRVRSSRD